MIIRYKSTTRRYHTHPHACVSLPHESRYNTNEHTRGYYRRHAKRFDFATPRVPPTRETVKPVEPNLAAIATALADLAKTLRTMGLGTQAEQTKAIERAVAELADDTHHAGIDAMGEDA